MRDRRKTLKVILSSALGAIFGVILGYSIGKERVVVKTLRKTLIITKTETFTPKPKEIQLILPKTNFTLNLISKLRFNSRIKVRGILVEEEKYSSEASSYLYSGDGEAIILIGFKPVEFSLVKSELICSLKNFILNSLLNNLVKIAVESISFKGGLWGLPLYCEAGLVLVRNEEVLRRAGVTEEAETWNEVVEHCLKVKREGLCKFPLGLPLNERAWETFQTLLHCWGSKFYEGEDCLYDSEIAVEVLNWMIDCIHKHKVYITTDHGEVDLFSSGMRAYSLIPLKYMKLLNDPAKSRVAGRVSVNPMPGVSGVKGGSLSYAPFIAASRGFEDVELGFEVMRAISNPSTSKELALSEGLTPPYKSVIMDEEVKNSPKTMGVDVWAKQRNAFLLSEDYCGSEVEFIDEIKEVAEIELTKALARMKESRNALNTIVDEVYRLREKYLSTE